MSWIDNEFSPEEELYLRLKPIKGGNAYYDLQEVPLHEVRFPDCSVNRSKYSAPEDVLKPAFPDWGIAMFSVKHVPDSLPHPNDGTVFDFCVEHDPTYVNYAHSEIRTYKEGVRLGKKKKVPGTVKTLFRVGLQAQMTLLKPPDFPDPEREETKEA